MIVTARRMVMSTAIYACASATATTQPVVRRWHVERRRRCEEMQDATRQPAGVNKEEGSRMDACGGCATKGDARRRHEAMRQPAGKREANGRRGASGQEATGPQLRQPAREQEANGRRGASGQEATGPQLRQSAREREANGRREERRQWTRGDGAHLEVDMT